MRQPKSITMLGGSFLKNHSAATLLQEVFFPRISASTAALLWVGDAESSCCDSCLEHERGIDNQRILGSDVFIAVSSRNTDHGASSFIFSWRIYSFGRYDGIVNADVAR